MDKETVKRLDDYTQRSLKPVKLQSIKTIWKSGTEQLQNTSVLKTGLWSDHMTKSQWWQLMMMTEPGMHPSTMTMMASRTTDWHMKMTEVFMDTWTMII
jgi:hypothetical protein